MRRGWLDLDEARAMRNWHNDGGFSLDAGVRIPGWDRAAPERLLRIGEINLLLHRPVSHPCSPFTRLRSATGRTVFAHPSAWDDAPVEVDPDYDPIAQPEPEMEFDQRIQW